MHNAIAIMVTITLGAAASLAEAAPKMRQSKDVSVKAKAPTPKDTIAFERLDKLVSHAGSGQYAKDRVISPPMTIPVRQMHPDGPTYQEALTYTFLMHSMKFAKLTRMDDGQLVLLASAWLVLHLGEDYQHDTGGERESVSSSFRTTMAKAGASPACYPVSRAGRGR